MNDFDYVPEYFFCLHISNDAYQRCQWNHSFFFRRHLTFPPFPMVRVYRKEFLSEKKCIKAKIGFPRQPEKGWQVEAQLYDPKGKAIFKKPLRSTVRAGDPFNWPRLQAEFDEPVKNPLLWSAELPHLYIIAVTLKNPTGKSIECTALRVGFRSVEVKDRLLLVNGKRVLIKGVNRHDHHDTKGKALDRETMRLDAVTMKRLNFNAVRASHYPNDPYWLDLCDELGLYLIDEANLESHAYY
jgi:beta-galactosidase